MVTIEEADDIHERAREAACACGDLVTAAMDKASEDYSTETVLALFTYILSELTQDITVAIITALKPSRERAPAAYDEFLRIVRKQVEDHDVVSRPLKVAALDSLLKDELEEKCQ